MLLNRFNKVFVFSVVSSKLKMIVKKIPLNNKDDLSLFQLFPAIQVKPTEWKVDDENLSELVDRLTTKEGADELRRVLDDPESSTEKMSKEIIMSEYFELQNELEIDKLLDKLGIQDLLEPDKATLSNFTDQNYLHNLRLGDVKHYARINVTLTDVTAGAINLFFTKGGGSLNQIKDINMCEHTNRSLWLLYCKERHCILFIGIINENK